MDIKPHLDAIATQLPAAPRVVNTMVDTPSPRLLLRLSPLLDGNILNGTHSDGGIDHPAVLYLSHGTSVCPKVSLLASEARFTKQSTVKAIHDECRLMGRVVF